jgi:hypothetical protein
MPFSGGQDQNVPAWGLEAADSRLTKTAKADPPGVLASDLSVSEYVLLGQAGFEPPGFAAGATLMPVTPHGQ